ncbi:PREDICTED: uncharacterized protein LOC106819763, partial [Priapulus caudatus]|uniref:Uncharacterized protein LOC106819763 n=1 Tax=Priapulus caudatus TaxID=37621 RepID=A0ABM1F5W9_PRICU
VHTEFGLQTSKRTDYDADVATQDLELCANVAFAAARQYIWGYQELLDITGIDGCPDLHIVMASEDDMAKTAEYFDCPDGSSQNDDACEYPRTAGAEAVWNGTLPICKDTQAPEWENCPDGDGEEWIVPVDNSGPQPINITWPTAVDNSGLVYYTSDPADLSSPYLFTKDTVVTFTASDQDGNVAVCLVNVRLVDVAPPILSCPAELYFDHRPEETMYVLSHLPHIDVTDNYG